MIAVVQRVSRARVTVDGEEVAGIEKGLLVLLGVKKGDGVRDVDYLVRKISGLRIFSDEEGKMNRALQDPDVNGELLAVSQFTLAGDVRKGKRPSFDKAEEPDVARKRFDDFVLAMRNASITVKTGVFGAMMNVELVNDGPVTLIVDSAVAR